MSYETLGLGFLVSTLWSGRPSPLFHVGSFFMYVTTYNVKIFFCGGLHRQPFQYLMLKVIFCLVFELSEMFKIYFSKSK